MRIRVILASLFGLCDRVMKMGLGTLVFFRVRGFKHRHRGLGNLCFYRSLRFSWNA